MSEIWNDWVGELSPVVFLSKVDRCISEGVFRDRRDAFLGFANGALATLACPYARRNRGEEGLSAATLADLLLRYAERVEGEAPRREGRIGLARG